MDYNNSAAGNKVQKSGTMGMFQYNKEANARLSVNSNLAVPIGRSPDRAASPNRGGVGRPTDPKMINFNDLNMLGLPRGASPARSRMSRGGSRMPGAPSRAGLSRAGSPRDPYLEIHSPEMIEKERRFERMREQLKR